MQTEILAINRVTGSEIELGANEVGDLLNAPGDADYTEITRGGKSFICKNTTAVAAVIAIPTTAIGFAIYNTAADGGRSIIIDSMFGCSVAAGAVLYQAELIYCLGQSRVVQPTNSAMLVRKLNMNGATTDSVAFTTIGGTALPTTAGTGVAINWFPAGDNTSSVIASLGGMGLWVPIDGRIIVAPGRYCAIHVLASAVGTTWNTGFMWHEKQITLA